eukprot:2054107-Alexandrium_andersonii.AAC.1
MGSPTFALFHDLHPAMCHEFRCALVSASLATHLRCVRRVGQWPFRLAVVADANRPMDDRLAVALEFVSTPLHDLDLAMGQKIRRAIQGDHLALFSPEWQR